MAKLDLQVDVSFGETVIPRVDNARADRTGSVLVMLRCTPAERADVKTTSTSS